MYTLLNKIGWSTFLAYEGPALLLSWILAELFYKFGSFTLETGAFLITWYGVGFLLRKLFRK
jgi:hypothetical protein